ncbi:nitric-oxide reductase large subunit [Sphaerimonospora cavernae]|uniref:Nitric-oxide reductase large subunit n=1 Tax=Sphaerimonospora cavernae TaxID=1740611 RepID=A0ABV6UD98_9ACTN
MTAPPSTDAVPHGRLLIHKAWVQVAVLVILFGFLVLGVLAYLTYRDEPPIPRQVVDDKGQVLFTGEDVTAGQQVFLRAGLMEYGSIFGHGAYLGPDFTADYLHRAATIARPNEPGGDTALIADFQANRYDPATQTLAFSGPQTTAYLANERHYADFFGDPTTGKGLLPHAITDSAEIHQLTSYFAWSAWAAAAHRPGADHSYTNSWPPEPLVGNKPTAENIVWSVLSLIALLGGIGALFGVYGRYGDRLGWRGRQADTLSFRQPGEVALTPAQRVTALFFFVVAALFVAQSLLGGASEHYRADLGSFFGIDLARLLPYNLTRTWHLQMALFWVAAAFLAAGIFLAPIIARREPRGQDRLSLILLGALVIVVVGSLLGEFFSIRGMVPASAQFIGANQYEYLDLARLWQILLTAGMGLWAFILWRGLRGRLRGEHRGNLPWMFFWAALAIPVIYAVGLLSRTQDTFTSADFWRFWVVHLWVEDFLELFTTVMVAYIFVLLGVVREKVALTVVYLDIVLYSVGGVIGTMHHLYFSGEPAQHMALGAFFSAAEVIPLTFLTVEAWSFLQLGARQESTSPTPFPHRWAVMFLVAVGFWNFLGAGIFGFLVNLPIVSYYEIGTGLTANHAHGSMMGVYGMLAIAMALFCLRYMIPPRLWPDRLAKISFWSLNIGLAWMCFATLLPVGILQLYHAVHTGYWHARSLKYLTNPTNSLIEWLRLPGDALFIVGGALPFLYITWLGLRHAAKAKPATPGEPEDRLFTEITGPAGR